MKSEKFKTVLIIILVILLVILVIFGNSRLTKDTTKIKEIENQLNTYKKLNDSLSIDLKTYMNLSDSLELIPPKIKIIYHEKISHVNSYNIYQLDSIIRSESNK